jgi:hypothetical protein
MNFKQWLLLSESSFFKITPEQNQAVLDIAQRLSNLKDSDMEKLFYDEMVDKEFGIIPFKNNQIKVFVNFDIDDLAAYHPEKNTITLTWNYIRKHNISQLIQTLIHELGHAIDPKLYPDSKHKVSGKYYDYVKQLRSAPNQSSGRMHFVEPIEVDAEGLSMKNHVMEYFKALKSKEDKQNFINELESWLKYHFNKQDGYSPPQVLANYYRSFMYAKSKPTLFRQYQKRFYKLIQELKASMDATGSIYDNISDDFHKPKDYQRIMYPPDSRETEEA